MAASTEQMLSAQGFEVEAGDVVKLVLQFLHEQGLSTTAGAPVRFSSVLSPSHPRRPPPPAHPHPPGELQRETGVALNTVDNRDHFSADIR